MYRHVRENRLRLCGETSHMVDGYRTRMRATRPVIPVDSGWLFIAAGLVMLFACVLIPPQKQMHELSGQLAALRAEERLAMHRLRAYSDFMIALDARDPTLTRRLAAAQLNLARRSDTPVLIAGTASAPVTEWIEASVSAEPVEISDFPASRLAAIVTGSRRHWLIAAAVGCLFIGLLTSARRAAPGE